MNWLELWAELPPELQQLVAEMMTLPCVNALVVAWRRSRTRPDPRKLFARSARQMWLNIDGALEVPCGPRMVGQHMYPPTSRNYQYLNWLTLRKLITEDALTRRPTRLWQILEAFVPPQGDEALDSISSHVATPEPTTFVRSVLTVDPALMERLIALACQGREGDKNVVDRMRQELHMFRLVLPAIMLHLDQAADTGGH